MNDDYIPLVSLKNFASLSSQEKTAISKKIGDGLKHSGFFVCADHGVPGEVTDQLQQTAYGFFDLPMVEKTKSKSTVSGSPRGYIPYGVETLSATDGRLAPPDIKEGYGIGPYWVDELEAPAVTGNGPSTYTRNCWPSQPENFKAVVLRYYREMEGLTAKLMELFALGMHLEPSFFAGKFKRHNSTLRLLHYPAQDTPPAPGQLRAGEHTDYGALTILLPQAGQGGLQVQKPNGRWEDVTAPAGAFVINIGDLMMTWSNDQWVSNRHRVVNPPADAGAAARRLSIAYFCNPEDSLMIECIPTCCNELSPAKYPPIQAGQYRAKKIQLSQLRSQQTAGS